VSGTLFEATKLPLDKWFLGLYLLTTTKTNMAALELMRHLGVCYRTAWRLKHKVMAAGDPFACQHFPHPCGSHAMTSREETRQLSGFVQIDDAYLGGERNGGKPGRGSENKQAFVIAVETDEQLQRPKFAVIEPVRSFTDTAITDWCKRRLMPQAEVFSDGLGAFRRCADQGHAHTVVVTKGGRASTQVNGARWVNVVLSNVKRSIDGAYHSIRQAKYARRYLGEAAYRFNRRFKLPELLPRLLRAMVLCGACAEPLLRRASNYLS